MSKSKWLARRECMMTLSCLLMLLARAHAACEAHCADACIALNGNVHQECGGCSNEDTCWPGAADWPEQIEGSANQMTRPQNNESKLCVPGMMSSQELLCRTNLESQAWTATSMWSHWAQDPGAVTNITRAIRTGRIVRIDNVLSPAVAEELFAEISATDAHWTEEAEDAERDEADGSTLDGIQYRRHVLDSCGDPGCPVLEHFHKGLEASAQTLWSAIAGVNLATWESSGVAQWFQFGDYLVPHTDLGWHNRENICEADPPWHNGPPSGSRGLTLVFHMTKGWPQGAGGGLWWLEGPPLEFRPSFNTLYAFVPSETSIHMVAPAMHDAPEEVRQNSVKRFSINGWLQADRAIDREATWGQRTLDGWNSEFVQGMR